MVSAAGSPNAPPPAALHAPPNPPCCPEPISVPGSLLWGRSVSVRAQSEPWKPQLSFSASYYSGSQVRGTGGDSVSQ